jgi:hypothetical protein
MWMGKSDTSKIYFPEELASLRLTIIQLGLHDHIAFIYQRPYIMVVCVKTPQQEFYGII